MAEFGADGAVGTATARTVAAPAPDRRTLEERIPLAMTPEKMTPEKRTDYVTALASAGAELNRLELASQSGVDTVLSAFRDLAAQADAILKQAGAIVGIVENEGIGTVLARVQTLCLEVKTFLEKRLEAASTILEALDHEQKLLQLLTLGTQRQRTIARHLKALSVLTNIEVAHLGDVGEDFYVLAQELSAFSNTVSQQTLELARQTENRELTIAETRTELASQLPQLRAAMSHMGDDFTLVLRRIDADLSQLASIPGQFKNCAEEAARQIAGVVAAIQAHDITRQQIEHVQHALETISPKISALDPSAGDELPVAFAGLTIQACQLKTTKETVASWTSQVQRCMGGIRQLSASDLVRIGPIVLKQEKELSAQLAKIGTLQEKSQNYSERIQNTLGGLSSLLELVNQHQERSQTVRHNLNLLMFNSLIKANHMGRRGAVVSSIANMIKGVSAEWNEITEHSGHALTEILSLVERANAVMEVFSEASSRRLREDRAQTLSILETVRGAAGLVAKEAVQMQVITEAMQAHLNALGDQGDPFDVCFLHLEGALSCVEATARSLETNDPHIAGRYDVAEAEKLFSELYTTEIEREVLRAALHGTPMPVLQQSIAGNDVELF